METSKFHHPTVIAIGVGWREKVLRHRSTRLLLLNTVVRRLIPELWQSGSGIAKASSLLLELDLLATGKLASEWRSRRINLQRGRFWE